MKNLRKLQTLLNRVNTSDGYVERFYKSELLTIVNDLSDEIESAGLGDIEKYEHHFNTTTGIVVTETTPCNLLAEFFQHKSDANKYLSAEQQEDLENEFKQYVESISYSI